MTCPCHSICFVLSGQLPLQAGRQHKRWPIAAITEVHHARFLLQPFALEIFLADRANALLSFPSAEVYPARSQ